MTTARKMVSLELNEVNFDFIQVYCARGKLPTFKRLLDSYELYETIAEKGYPLLEPWIQWPTVYTGKSFNEHGLFRLGDVVEKDIEQIWESLERRGVRVGAVSPMNAANRCTAPAFFIPDPWTVTPVGGSASLQKLYELVRDAVNRNSHDERSLWSLALSLMPFVAKYSRKRSLHPYARVLRYASKYKWARALFLDRFLGDLFLRLHKKHRPQFSSLFLNAAAHVQHHHMFDSTVYAGDAANPSWYSRAKLDGVDPLLCAYEVYDSILKDVLALRNTRVLVTTGLSQYPNSRCMYQYRLKDHSKTLMRLGVNVGEVVPRMSRDFLLQYASAETALAAATALQRISIQGASAFAIENRGTSLFCQLSYQGSLDGFKRALDARGVVVDLRDDVALVSIENGLHRTIGFHVDTNIPLRTRQKTPQIPLSSIHTKMVAAFEVRQSSSVHSMVTT